MSKNDGGTAFPMQDASAVHAYAFGASHGIKDHEQRELAYIKARGEAVTGMTLRDYFAAKAMNGICAHHDTWGLAESEMAEHAYRIADAMLAARVKP